MMSHTDRLSLIKNSTMIDMVGKMDQYLGDFSVHGLPSPRPILIVRVHLGVAVSGRSPGVRKWRVNCYLVAAVHQSAQHAPHEIPVTFSRNRLDGQHAGGIRGPWITCYGH